MHATVYPAEVDKEVERRPSPVGVGIEQTNLDVGVGVEGGSDEVGTAGFVEGIVDEKSHFDAAIGRPDHAVDDDPPGRVSFPVEILHIEIALCQIGQRQSHNEGLAPLT